MAAATAGSGTPREEEGPSGEAAAPHPQTSTNAPGPRLSRLPLARVKALVKADPDVTLAGQEAIFILARAAVRRERTVCGDHCKRCLLLCSTRKEENPPEERFG
ncbi:DNA polymerase epsilon subunit 4 isoform X2 [Rhinolophus ferrumequinum]|uniref:DNA polymerase epsilon subunit 4 isoform X2 n=1 Tax=Rhinolophus ferrumequinum TaxID=59479 RepID=UPI00140FA38A|nr:DNA polymerase epsilon subunit 4 isoform X2 [Rhinolophus ferrumequinum]